MKTRSLITLHALVNLYSNSDARWQTDLNQSVKNCRRGGAGRMRTNLGGSESLPHQSGASVFTAWRV